MSLAFTLDEVAEFIQQGFIFVVSKFTGIKIHAVVVTGLIPDMGLFRVRDRGHDLAAAWAIDVFDLVIFFTNLGIATVDKLGHPLTFKGLGLTNIKPDTFAVGAAVDGHVAAVGNFFHG